MPMPRTEVATSGPSAAPNLDESLLKTSVQFAIGLKKLDS
jgi:hypothetical protein